MLVAVTGFLVGAAGIYLNYKGMRDQRRQQDAANLALRDKSRIDETQMNLDAAMARAEKAEAASDRKDTRIDALQARVNQLEQEVDEAHLLRRQQLSAANADCREHQNQLVDALATLRAVVVDEMARAAADTVLHEAREHPHGPIAPPLDGDDF